MKRKKSFGKKKTKNKKQKKWESKRKSGKLVWETCAGN